MLDPESHSLSGLVHAAGDMLIASIAGGLVLLVFYPITLCAAGVKAVMGRGGRPSPSGGQGRDQRRESQERAERQFIA